MKLNAKNFREWIAALRSGDYKQGRSCLRNVDNERCCIGVMMDLVPSLSVIPPDHITSYQYRYVTPDRSNGSSTGMITPAWNWLFDDFDPEEFWDSADLFVDYPFEFRPDENGWVSDYGLSAMLMNDTLRLSFDQIADVFEYFGPRPPEPTD